MVRNPEENPELMVAVNDYLVKKGLSLPDNAKFGYMIDGVYIDVEHNTVLIVGLPPVSNYEIEETEQTSKYLRPHMAIAV